MVEKQKEATRDQTVDKLMALLYTAKDDDILTKATNGLTVDLDKIEGEIDNCKTVAEMDILKLELICINLLIYEYKRETTDEFMEACEGLSTDPDTMTMYIYGYWHPALKQLKD